MNPSSASSHLQDPKTASRSGQGGSLGNSPRNTQQRSGNLKLVVKHKFPVVFGQDFAGEVVDVGEAYGESGAERGRFAPGDLVFGGTAPRNGCGAEFVLAEGTELAKLELPVGSAPLAQPSDAQEAPSGAGAGSGRNDFLRLAAACPTAFCTAWRGLFDVGGCVRPIADADKWGASEKAGDKGVANTGPLAVLVIGASGSVGQAAVQLARVVAEGVGRVVGVCGRANLGFVREELGAHASLCYDSAGNEGGMGFDEVCAAKRWSFDLILDCVGGDEYYRKCQSLLNLKNK